MDINSGGSFGANPLRKEIGIGKADKIDQLRITWPTTGIVQEFNYIMPNQFLKIKEGNDQPEKMDLRVLKFVDHNGKMINCGPPVP